MKHHIPIKFNLRKVWLSATKWFYAYNSFQDRVSGCVHCADRDAAKRAVRRAHPDIVVDFWR